MKTAIVAATKPEPDELAGMLEHRSRVERANRSIYFGPMGCLTGCSLLLKGDLEKPAILALVRDMFQFIADYEDKVPGAAPEKCSNWRSQDLPMAGWEARYSPARNWKNQMKRTSDIRTDRGMQK